DLPLDHPFSYLLPGDLKLACGQRVRAPLGGRGTRVGMVVALREGDESGLRPVQHVVDAAPIVSAAGLDLGRWIADESLSSWGSTLLALVPPPSRARRTESVAPAPDRAPSIPAREPELWTSADRDERLTAMLAAESEAALVIAPDTASAARWARRLAAAHLAGPARGARPRAQAAWTTAASLARHPHAARRPRRQPPHPPLGGAVGRELGASRRGRRQEPPRRRRRLAPDHRGQHARHPAQPSPYPASHPGDRGDVPARPRRRAHRGPRHGRARLQ